MPGRCQPDGQFSCFSKQRVAQRFGSEAHAIHAHEAIHQFIHPPTSGYHLAEKADLHQPLYFFIDIQLQFRWVGCIGFFGTIVEADQELTRQQRVGYRKLRFASIFFSSGTTASVKANRTPSNGVSVILES